MTDTETRDPAARLRVALRDWLRRSDLTQHEFAKKVGVRQSVVSRWLTADPDYQARPSIESLQRIAEIVDKPLADLLTMAGYTPDLGRRDDQDALTGNVLPRPISTTYSRWMELVGPRVGEREADQMFWQPLAKVAKDGLSNLERFVAPDPQPSSGTAVSGHGLTAISGGVSGRRSATKGRPAGRRTPITETQRPCDGGIIVFPDRSNKQRAA